MILAAISATENNMLNGNSNLKSINYFKESNISVSLVHQPEVAAGIYYAKTDTAVINL